MSNRWQIGTTSEAEAYNERCFRVLISDDGGITYKWPFDGDVDFVRWQDEHFLINDFAQLLSTTDERFTSQERQDNIDYIATAKTEAEAIELGWIPDPDE